MLVTVGFSLHLTAGDRRLSPDHGFGPDHHPDAGVRCRYRRREDDIQTREILSAINI
jgi:hypothetical protein